MPKVVLKCKGCGKEFQNYLSSGRVYCSKLCVPYSKHVTTHGESRTRLHGIWCSMKTRCLCATAVVYPYYGGRGITVCQEWVNDYLAFRNWAKENGYTEELELDRINVNGNYEPSNCRWSTRHQQMANTRKRCDGKTSRFKGVSWNRLGSNWKVQITKNGKNTYVGIFGSEVDAAIAYDQEASRLRGEYALLNFQEQGGVPS